jgi:hypothetical protein
MGELLVASDAEADSDRELSANAQIVVEVALCRAFLRQYM